MERLSKDPEHSKRAYRIAERASLTNRMTPEERLLGAIFGDAPSLEELRAWTPEDIERIMVGLSDEERMVVRLRFGLDDEKPRTFREVGDVIAKSPSTACRVGRRSLDKLRNPQTQV